MNIDSKSGRSVFQDSLPVLVLSLLLFATVTSAAFAGPEALRISYVVSMDDALNHNFRVKMTLEGVSEDTLVLKIPVWTPGYYWIQNYPKNLSRLEIHDAAGRECPEFEKLTKQKYNVIYTEI